MLADDALGNGKAQAGATGTATDHRIENVLHQLRRNAGAVVDNVDPAHEPVASVANGELAQGAGTERTG